MNFQQTCNKRATNHLPALGKVTVSLRGDCLWDNLKQATGKHCAANEQLRLRTFAVGWLLDFICRKRITSQVTTNSKLRYTNVRQFGIDNRVAKALHTIDFERLLLL